MNAKHRMVRPTPFDRETVHMALIARVRTATRDDRRADGRTECARNTTRTSDCEQGG
jgi:hypothetical protein